MSTPNPAQTAAATSAVPEGFKRDARGRLVPLSLVRPVDQMRDELVRELIEEAERVHDLLCRFKGRVFSDLLAFVDVSAEKYGVAIGGRKGNVTFHSFDGQYRIQLATAETITFDERLQAAKALIDECIEEWSKGSRAEIQALVAQAFETNQEGKLNTGRILGLQRLEITEDRWMRAMKAVRESVQVVGTKQYVRFYKRVGDTDQYAPISLDIASL